MLFIAALDRLVRAAVEQAALFSTRLFSIAQR